MKKEVNKEYVTKVATGNETQEPPLYKIEVHNDDYTPMEFVVGILEKFFYMSRRKATAVMLEAHLEGKALCGIFSKDYAEAKITQIVEYARQYEHPLNCSTEPA